MRDIIIGDVHGEYGELCSVLKKVNPGTEDRVIFLGDLFDRGPCSWEVFQKVREMEQEMGERFVLLRGNHEDFLLREKLSPLERRIWEKVGRASTVKSFKEHGKQMEDTIPWIRAHCQLYWKGKGYQCVHAGLKVDPPEVNDLQTLIHDHDIVLQNEYKGPLTVVGHVALEAPTWFAGDGETVKELPYGERMPLPETGIIAIDTGSGKGGSLTAMAVKGEQYMLYCSL